MMPVFAFKEFGTEKFLHKDNFSLADDSSDMRVFVGSKEEADLMLSEINDLSQDNDNDDSRNCRRPSFWFFVLVEFGLV